jgi:hypothetical protein
MLTPREQLRDGKGRYVHEWGVMGSHVRGDGSYREVAECSHCDKVHAYGGGPDRHYKNRAAAVRAGEILLDGYTVEGN